MADKPVKKFRVGFVSASIWKNKVEDRTFHNVTLERTYKDGEGFKQTNSLAHGDLLNAAQVLTRAETWIAEQD